MLPLNLILPSISNSTVGTLFIPTFAFLSIINVSVLFTNSIILLFWFLWSIFNEGPSPWLLIISKFSVWYVLVFIIVVSPSISILLTYSVPSIVKSLFNLIFPFVKTSILEVLDSILLI